MALTIEDGSGVTGADSYISVADAQAYYTSIGYVYSSYTDAQIEAALRRAMITLEAQPWKGVKADDDNALEWPRDEVTDVNYFDVDDDTVPVKVARAQALLAFKELSDSGGTYADLERGGKIKKIKAGSIELEYVDGAPGGTEYQVVKYLLKGLIYTGIKTVRT